MAILSTDTKKARNFCEERAFLVQLEIFYDAAISRRLKPNNKGEVPIGFNFKQLKTVLQHHRS